MKIFNRLKKTYKHPSVYIHVKNTLGINLLTKHFNYLFREGPLALDEKSLKDLTLEHISCFEKFVIIYFVYFCEITMSIYLKLNALPIWSRSSLGGTSILKLKYKKSKTILVIKFKPCLLARML